MGHIRVGTLPQTRNWQEVVTLIGLGAGAPQVATAAARAAAGALAAAADDRLFVEALWLLVRLPLAARSDDFAAALRGCGMDVPTDPGFADILGAVADALDARTPNGKGRTDLGEMAQSAAAATLAAVIGRALDGRLFGVGPDDVRAAFAAQATPAKFGPVVRAFFADFADRFLNSFLSRTLGGQVGPDQPFRTLADHDRFRDGVKTHCREAAGIIEAFAGEWLAKHNWQSAGEIDRDEVSRFAGHAAKKLDDEFRRRGTD